MNTKKILLILVITFSVINTGFSQIRKGKYIGSFEYSVAFNTGRANDFISDPGWAGANLAFKQFVKDNVALGLSFGWNIFGVEDENGKTELSNGTITGPQAKYINYIPLYGIASYYFGNKRGSTVIPYIQANVGTVYVKQRFQIGALILDNDNWHFAAGPEAGLMFKVGKDVGISLSGKYNYCFSSGETLKGEGSNDFSFINANIGLSYIR